MFTISNNGIVTVNRGDSFELPIVLNYGDPLRHHAYTLQLDDTLYVGIMEPNQPFETAILKKVITYNDVSEDGNIFVRFWPEDTICLLPGKYYYQVKLQTVDVDSKTGQARYDVETVVDKTLFYIQE